MIVDDRDTIIRAKYIWIRAGSLTAGNATNPFGFKLSIFIEGESSYPTYVIDPNLAARKCLVVTGRLLLYGTAPGTTSTRLTSKAEAGDTTITVDSL